MAITLRNTSTYGLNSYYSTSVPIPTGTQNGDIIIALTTYYSGFMTGQTMTSLGDRRVTHYYSAFYKIWNTGDPTGITFSVSSGGSRGKVTMASYYGDFNTSSPIDSFSNTQYITSNNIVRAASINVSEVNSAIIFFGGVYSTSARTFTKPTGLTNLWVEDYDGGDTGSDMWHTFDSIVWSGNGATGLIDVIVSTTATTKHAFMVALKPPLTPPPPRRRIYLTHM